MSRDVTPRRMTRPPPPRHTERLRPSEKLAFLQNIMRNGGEVDPLEMLQMGANSKGFQVRA